MYTADAAFVSPGHTIDKYKSGTSMATPVASGTAALVQEAHPYMTSRQIGDVILSTANKNIRLSEDGKVQVSLVFNTPDDNNRVSIKSVNVYYIGDGKEPIAVRSPEQVKADALAIIAKDESNKKYISGWIKTLDTTYNNFVAYYDVPLEEFVGQGVVDAGKAVNGLGAVNIRRMNPQESLRTLDKEYVEGYGKTQALYNIDTQGYDATWSNDISEVQTGYLSDDSEQEDLKSIYHYYERNFLQNDAATSSSKSLTQDYINIYNQDVTDSGFLGVHGGIYKTGAGSLTLTGNNSYKGVTIAADGTIYVDGSVAGGARSEGSGVIGGSGTIKGMLDNTNAAVAGSLDVQSGQKLTADSYTGGGKLYVQLTDTGTTAENNTAFEITGEADITGSKILTTGDEYLPYDGREKQAFRAGSYIGNFANEGVDNAEALTGTLSIYANKNSNDTGYGVVIEPHLNVENPSEGTRQGFEGLNEIYTVQKQKNGDMSAIKTLYNLDKENAGRALQGISGYDMAGSVNIAQRFNTANTAIGPRLVQVFSKPSYINIGAMHFMQNELGNNSGMVVPLNNDPIEGDWMKYTRMWNYLGDANANGTVMTFGYDKEVGVGKRLGIFGSYGTHNYANGDSRSNLYDYRLGIYGGFQHGAADGYAYIDYGWQRYHDTRYLSVFNDSFDANHNGHLLEIGGEYRYDLNAYNEKLWHVRPYINMQMSRAFNDGYTENTSNVFGLSVKSQTQNYAASELGFDFYRPLPKNGMYTLRLGYKHIFAGYNPGFNYRYIGGNGSMHTSTAHLDKDFLTAKFQIEQPVGNNWSLRGEFSLEKGAHEKNIFAGASVMYNW